MKTMVCVILLVFFVSLFNVYAAFGAQDGQLKSMQTGPAPVGPPTGIAITPASAKWKNPQLNSEPALGLVYVRDRWSELTGVMDYVRIMNQDLTLTGNVVVDVTCPTGSTGRTAKLRTPSGETQMTLDQSKQSQSVVFDRAIFLRLTDFLNQHCQAEKLINKSVRTSLTFEFTCGNPSGGQTPNTQSLPFQTLNITCDRRTATAVPTKTVVGYYHTCPAGYKFKSGGGSEGMKPSRTPEICVR